jgi:hypothetical protein
MDPGMHLIVLDILVWKLCWRLKREMMEIGLIYWNEVRRCFVVWVTIFMLSCESFNYIMFADFAVVKNVHQLMYYSLLRRVFDFQFIFMLSFLFNWWTGTGFPQNCRLSLIHEYISVTCRFTLLQCFCWNLDARGTTGVHNHSEVMII